MSVRRSVLGEGILPEERLIPLIRARLAIKLAHRGFRVKEIAQALRVSPPAVTQYIVGRRGASAAALPNIDDLLEPLAERLSRRIRLGLGIEPVELLETAKEVSIVIGGKEALASAGEGVVDEGPLELLRSRLRLELDAAEKYLELANRTSDDYTKLLLRMIAADSIRHGDVVSQLISWIEAGRKGKGLVPEESILKSMLSIEDSAREASLLEEIQVEHPVARLLLNWIDLDEAKHEKMVRRLLTLSRVGSEHQKGALRGRPGPEAGR
ncbi:MAG TPA: hypothetical protein VMS77_06985 [Conexivisphaerales archaeon]|nr:hypothetical protein [Conexivisphaerales archaeon]